MAILQASVFRLFDDGPGAQRSRTFAIYALLVGANIAAWGWALAEFGSRPTLLATALLAYVFGLRHAVDADHIAAIDNVVRKLMQEGKRPLSVGLFFALGHSTVVVLASVAIAATAAAIQTRFAAFKDIGAIIGTGVSALFLLAIAAVNLVILRGVWRNYLRVRRGSRLEPESLDGLLSGQGFLARLFQPFFRMISRSRHMYLLGFLFALGFDTATEIGVLGISAAQAADGMSLCAMLIFPALFTAGMALVDTTDGVLMVRAYGWAFADPIRKLWYNITVTAVSVLVAGLIGGIEALGLVAEKLSLDGHFWKAVTGLNDMLGTLGLGAVAIFLVCWIVSALIYRWKRHELAPYRGAS